MAPKARLTRRTDIVITSGKDLHMMIWVHSTFIDLHARSRSRSGYAPFARGVVCNRCWESDTRH